jgi:pimeloyl-ACP methyl ester carboxylesterase
MTLSMVSVGDAELCVDTFGDEGDPTVLLLGGATSSMDWWEPDFCERIAGAGRFVIRYDHRDTGQSTTSPTGAPSYTGADLSADPLRLLDALGIMSAHLVGVSMGGGIAQDIAANHPDRVLSLTLIATTAAFERADPTPLPGPEARVMEQQDDDDLDWDDTDAVVDRMVDVHRLYAGSLGVDDERVRAISRRVVERSHDVRASVTNHWLVIGGEDDNPPRTMADITAPTLVLHGTDDPMFPLDHGRALAAEIAGARLVPLEGMGHEAPPYPLWDLVVREIVALTAP